jgi:uncharacterized protein YjaG (DUF416 family)
MAVEFEMFTEEGNEACTQAFKNIYDVIFGDKFVTENELKKLIKEQIAQVEATHPEVHDTEPEYHFVDRINGCLGTRGYSYKVNRNDL